MNREQLINVYLDFKNNYLSVEYYASIHGLYIDEAMALINLARDCFNHQHPDL